MKRVKSIAAVLVILAIVFPLASCATAPTSPVNPGVEQQGEDKVSIKDRVFTKENMDRAITFIKGLQTSITVVGPLACAGCQSFSQRSYQLVTLQWRGIRP